MCLCLWGVCGSLKQGMGGNLTEKVVLEQRIEEGEEDPGGDVVSTPVHQNVKCKGRRLRSANWSRPPTSSSGWPGRWAASLALASLRAMRRHSWLLSKEVSSFYTVNCFFFFLRQGLIMQPNIAWNFLCRLG